MPLSRALLPCLTTDWGQLPGPWRPSIHPSKTHPPSHTHTPCVPPCPMLRQQTVRLSLGKEIPAVDYTLPRLWQHVKSSCDYQRRAAEAAAFNEGSPWVKRGLGLTHTR